jgi:hypothetical protein
MELTKQTVNKWVNHNLKDLLPILLLMLTYNAVLASLEDILSASRDIPVNHSQLTYLNQAIEYAAMETQLQNAHKFLKLHGIAQLTTLIQPSL